MLLEDVDQEVGGVGHARPGILLVIAAVAVVGEGGGVVAGDSEAGGGRATQRSVATEWKEMSETMIWQLKGFDKEEVDQRRNE